MNHMAKIMVTGANGFLGREVMTLLKENNYNYFGVGRDLSIYSNVLCDLSIPEQVSKVLEKINPEIIINLTATVDF